MFFLLTFNNDFMKLFLQFFLFVIIKFNINGQCSIDKTQWIEVFNEEFNGNTISNYWKFTYAGGSSILKEISASNPWEPVNKPNNITIANGFAYFNTVKENTLINGVNHLYSVGLLRSSFDDTPFAEIQNDYELGGYLYGMFEIKCKLPKINGTYPAFWFTGNNAWPPEVDVFEFNGSLPNEFFSTVHWPHPLYPNPKDAFCGSTFSYPFDLTENFHTFSLVWTPTKLTWFFDGIELKTDTDPDHVPGHYQSNHPNEIAKWRKMDLIIGSGLNWPDPNNTDFLPFIVDYVKVYKPANLPKYSGNINGWAKYYRDTLLPAYANTTFKPTNDWVQDLVISEQPYLVQTGMNSCQNGQKFWYKGQFNLLWNTYKFNYGSGYKYYSAPIDWNENIDGNVNIADNGEVVYYVKSGYIKYYQNNQIFEVKANSFQKANDFSKNLKVSDDGLRLYYGNVDCQYIKWNRSNLSSNIWTKTTIDAVDDFLSNALEVNSNLIYYINVDNQICQLEFVNGNWTKNILLPSSHDVKDNLQIVNNTLYYRNTSNQLCYYSNNFGNWVKLYFFASSPYSNNIEVVSNVGDDLIVSNISSNLKIYFSGLFDHRPWNIYWNIDKYTSAPIMWNITNIESDFQLPKGSNGNVLVFRDFDNQFRVLKWEACEFLNPDCLGPIVQKGSLNEEVNKTANNSFDDLIVYPNPTTGFIFLKNIDLNLPFNKITLYDFTGQKIQLIDTQIFNPELNIINLSSFQSGIYYLSINNSSSFKSFKIIKITQ